MNHPIRCPIHGAHGGYLRADARQDKGDNPTRGRYWCSAGRHWVGIKEVLKA